MHKLIGFYIRDEWDFIPSAENPRNNSIWVIVDLAEPYAGGSLSNLIATNNKQYIRVETCPVHPNQAEYRAMLRYKIHKDLYPIIDKCVADLLNDLD